MKYPHPARYQICLQNDHLGCVNKETNQAIPKIQMIIHDFRNGGPLGRSGNESHQSEASKATVTKTIQNKSKRRDATPSNLTDLSTAGI